MLSRQIVSHRLAIVYPTQPNILPVSSRTKLFSVMAAGNEAGAKSRAHLLQHPEKPDRYRHKSDQ